MTDRLTGQQEVILIEINIPELYPGGLSKEKCFLFNSSKTISGLNLNYVIITSRPTLLKYICIRYSSG